MANSFKKTLALFRFNEYNIMGCFNIIETLYLIKNAQQEEK